MPSRPFASCVLRFTVTAALVGAPSFAATAPSDSLPDRVTWAEHVAPLVHRECAACHRPGDIAPMSLLTYDEARPWAKGMLRAVEDGLMPPWHADPTHGKFANDRSLDEGDKELLRRWVKQGARPGELERAPTPPVAEAGWRLGEPDLVLAFEEVALAAGGRDVFPDLEIETGLTAPRWVRAIEIRPGNRQVVHHVILYASADSGPPASGWLGAWAAGMDPMVFPAGTGKLLEPGQKIVADMHYHPAPDAATDRTEVGLYFHDGLPEKELINLWVQNGGFKIPAGAKDHVVRSTHTFREDAIVYGLLPHMHYRGKEFTYTVTYPDGRSEVLLHVPRYDFNWQTVYQLAEPLRLPAGARIDCEAHYDNSADNPANPDPTRDVTFGNESYDEMMIGFVDYVVAEGMRPKSVEQQLSTLRAAALAEEATRVFDVRVTQEGEDEHLDTVLALPANGDGLWWIPMNGQIIEAALTERAQDGDAFKATLVAAFGQLQVEGSLQEERATGTITMGQMILTFEGKLASSSADL